MPMPKKDDRSVRREQFPVRWSKDELDMLKDKARRRGIQPSAYLRFLVRRDKAPK